ncbi:hypothetical protein B0H15DRAFT_954405 [Mycena belliarum]|uniref:Uncharacterized protein n=1 Tax=Mycena belliarum TaxID=1033014 RepID=A0AAD6TT31_9AGAR|nr:hypothetical protein B0H15DRAFT_954405 [Mycena belliae]
MPPVMKPSKALSKAQINVESNKRFIVMKLTSSLISIAPLLVGLPTAYALVGSSWSVTNVPAAGLTDITFPITIVEAGHISGYYFAQQFDFVNLSDVGYTGVQPRPDNAKGSVHQ